MTESDTAFRRARERVNAIRGWYVHLIVYVAVNTLLVGIDLAEGGGLDYAYWTVLGWGIGLAVHSAFVWVGGRAPLGNDWEERKVRELIEKERSSSSGAPDARQR